jgi:hypothetical protein
VPYAASGNCWLHPELITISFVPDGTVVAHNSSGGNIISNLFATFNARWAQATWQNVILKAAQVWAQQANINFAVVTDDGSPAGSGALQQGAANFGDIRIGGYNFNSGTTLASTFYPQTANNYSVAGDMNFNTAQNFNIGTTYDLFTVAVHEIGHALGLGHSAVSTADMYGVYLSAKTALGCDDVNGIRAIYGARPSDGTNNSFTSATDVSSLIDPAALTAVVNNQNITSTSASDYFTFTAPAGSAGAMTVTVQSTGLSLFTPSVTVYAADQMTVLGSATYTPPPGAVRNGATLSVNVGGVTPGSAYYVVVQGADATAWSTGKYALALNLGTGANPTVTTSNTQTANGSPLSSGGGIPLDPSTWSTLWQWLSGNMSAMPAASATTLLNNMTPAQQAAMSGNMSTGTELSDNYEVAGAERTSSQNPASPHDQGGQLAAVFGEVAAWLGQHPGTTLAQLLAPPAAPAAHDQAPGGRSDGHQAAGAQGALTHLFKELALALTGPDGHGQHGDGPDWSLPFATDVDVGAV